MDSEAKGQQKYCMTEGSEEPITLRVESRRGEKRKCLLCGERGERGTKRTKRRRDGGTKRLSAVEERSDEPIPTCRESSAKPNPEYQDEGNKLLASCVYVLNINSSSELFTFTNYKFN